MNPDQQQNPQSLLDLFSPPVANAWWNPRQWNMNLQGVTQQQPGGLNDPRRRFPLGMGSMGLGLMGGAGMMPMNMLGMMRNNNPPGY